MSAPVPLREHGWRHNRGSLRFRDEYWMDWQIDEGASMDAPTLWQPAGATRVTCYLEGTNAAYALRSGHAHTGELQPAVQFVFPTVHGQRYRCRLERGRLAEARAERAGARGLRKGSALYHKVETAAWRQAA